MAQHPEHVDIEDSVGFLASRKVITDDSATVLRPSQSRKIRVPNLDEVEADVMFLCLLLDASGSMHVCRDSVIKAQHMALDALRVSAACRKKALYLSQYLFSDAAKPLQEPTLLAPEAADDDVTLLTEQEYEPYGRTALYQTVHHVLQDVAALTAFSVKKGLKPLFVVGLCTDGKDTEGGVTAEQIRQIVGELRGKNYMLGATVIGFESEKYPASCFAEIQERLGFDKHIICNRENPKEIRDAFFLWSQSIIAFCNRF